MYGAVIRINRADYRIQWVKEIILNGEQLAGLCNIQDKILYVDVTSEIEATLLHEVIHGEFHESGIKQRDDWCRNVEEQVCEMISQALSANFRFRKK